MPNVYTFKDFEGSSHRILIDLITRYSNGARTLLDLGAAGGELGEALRSRFKRTIGFEYDVDRIADLHKHFDQAVIADLETVRKLPNHPDAIVLADILEHLRDQKALRCVREALPPEGHIQTVGIANVTVRIGLLLGIFEYRERGILDHHICAACARSSATCGAGFPSSRSAAPRSNPPVVPWAPEFLRLGERILTIVTRSGAGCSPTNIIVARWKARRPALLPAARRRSFCDGRRPFMRNSRRRRRYRNRHAITAIAKSTTTPPDPPREKMTSCGPARSARRRTSCCAGRLHIAAIDRHPQLR
jgi:hypothetical protein